MTYPKIDRKKKIVEIGDGTVMSLSKYREIRKWARKKCKDCGHAYEDHTGVCRYSRGLMVCTCQRNY